MSNIINFPYEGQAVRFNLDGWINATDVAKRFGKKPVKWLELPRTKSYIAALARALGVSNVRKSDFGLVKTSRGGHQAGTWLHPKLAVSFARWLDDDFAVWCDMQIDTLLRGEINAMHHFEQACIRLDEQIADASDAGRRLCANKWKRPALESQVDFWRNQLQLTLSLPKSA
ncbi:KilA-N domain-containing protein [Carnimonas bestiolae]|uniref:KilA-N domain-containing protein n=1 Tax=Carnimonas bestiolae TaxID=3402172 RepID=UPI003EDBD003